MTATERAELVGREGTVNLDGLNVSVVVVDVRDAWGRLQLQVRPVSGNGEIWVLRERTRLHEGRSVAAQALEHAAGGAI